jgi:hypothetical protein
MLTKVQDEQHAQLQKSMNSVKNMMKMENKCRTNFRDEMDPMTRAERTPSMPMKQTVRHLASKQSPVGTRVPRKTYPVAFMPKAEKIKAPVSKARVGLMLLQNVKIVTAMLDTRSNVRHKPVVESQARFEEHAGQDQHMKQDTASGGGHKKTEKTSVCNSEL